MVLWLSCAIALFLYHRFQLSILKLEMRLLVFYASIVAIFSCWSAEFAHWQGNALGALLAGIVFFLVVGWLGQGLRRTPSGETALAKCHEALKPIYSLSAYYFGATARHPGNFNLLYRAVLLSTGPRTLTNKSGTRLPIGLRIVFFDDAGFHFSGNEELKPR